mgnify:CR=1 FL=1
MQNDVIPKIVKKQYDFHIRKPTYSERSPIDFSQAESVTDTTFGNDTDVNRIIARCKRTGEPLPDNGPGQYADCSNLQKDLSTLIDEAKSTLDEYAEQQAKESAKVARNAQTDAEKAKQYDELMKQKAESEQTPSGE